MIRLARGAWCLDIILLVEGSDDPFENRAAGWDTTRLRVPADVLVYTREEWGRLSPTSAFHRMVMHEGRLGVRKGRRQGNPAGLIPGTRVAIGRAQAC